MKKRYLVSALLGSTLLLGACNQGDDDSKHHNDKKETSHKTEDKKSHKVDSSKSKITHRNLRTTIQNLIVQNIKNRNLIKTTYCDGVV